jgi:membrane fusion protein
LLVAQAMAARRATLDTERRLVRQQSRHRDAVLSDRLRSLEAERRQAEANAASAKRRLELTRRTFDRFSQLAAEGFVSPMQAQDQEARWLDATVQVRDHERMVTALGRDIDAARAERAAGAAQAQADQARLERALAALDQEAREDAARRRVLLVAHRAGTVGTLTAHVGETLLAGQPLATVLAGEASQPAHLEAHLYAESRTAGFIRQGQAVRLRYDAYPHQKFGMAEGRVTAVSHTPIAPQNLPPGVHARESLYRLTVRLARQSIDVYGRSEALKPGMTLKGDVQQDTRPIWEWLLAPLLSAAKSAKPIHADL